MSVTGMGTVTYNDGKRVLAFGHPFFNLGPLDMPMAKSEILMMLASAFQPTKFGNATEVVGALHQDRYSGIMGVLGEEAPMIPVHLEVRSIGANDSVVREKDFHFNVFVHQKWTPFLMMLTLFNSLQQMNEYADEMTYRMSGERRVDGTPDIHVSTMLAPSEMPVPAPMVLAGWWGDKFNRLFLNPVNVPEAEERRCHGGPAARAPRRHHRKRLDADPPKWMPAPRFPSKFSCGRIAATGSKKPSWSKYPPICPKATIGFCSATPTRVNRMQHAVAAGNRYMDIPETVSLLNQEHEQQSAVRLAGGRPAHLLCRRQNASRAARFHSERACRPNAPPAAR